MSLFGFLVAGVVVHSIIYAWKRRVGVQVRYVAPRSQNRYGRMPKVLTIASVITVRGRCGEPGIDCSRTGWRLPVVGWPLTGYGGQTMLTLSRY
jgi:hypothetical protein